MKDIKIGPDEMFGEEGDYNLEEMAVEFRRFYLAKEKRRIMNEGLANALSGIINGVTINEADKIISVTIDLPFKEPMDWEDIKKAALVYDNKYALLVA